MNMVVETHCSICGKKLGGKDARKETRVGIFEPHFHKGQISHFAMGDNILVLCKSCTQSLYSWIKNRREKTAFGKVKNHLDNLRKITDKIVEEKSKESNYNSYIATPCGPGDCACVDECLAKRSREEKEFLSMAEKRRYDAVTDAFMDNVEFTKS